MIVMTALAAAYAVWLGIFILRPASQFWTTPAGAIASGGAALSLFWLSLVALIPQVLG
ncbi:MAG TPA: hypothetical protein VNS02_04975 [Rhizobiaceae bacterium]|nr:hypothetical protein [Rhizobiaceae bacterium]